MWTEQRLTNAGEQPALCRAGGVGLLFRLCSSCIRHLYSRYQRELRKSHHVSKIPCWTARNTWYLQQHLPHCPKLGLTGLFWMKWETNFLSGHETCKCTAPVPKAQTCFCSLHVQQWLLIPLGRMISNRKGLTKLPRGSGIKQGRGSITPLYFKHSGFGRWLYSSLPFSASAVSSLSELSFSACDSIAVSKSYQLRYWQESAACYGKDIVKAEIFSQRSRTTSLQTLCSIKNIKLPSQMASGGF